VKENRLGTSLGIGVIVFTVGTVLNVTEFWMSVTGLKNIVIPIWVMATIDAALIAYVFMHIHQLWRPEE
jgi:hypothetical protein